MAENTINRKEGESISMYELEFKEEEIRVILNALDFYSRIWIGQYREIMMDLRWYRNYKQLDDLDEILRRKFWNMRIILLPKLRHYDLSASHGIFSPDRDVKAAIAYDMQQEFRYRRAWFLKPEGGYTVDFGSPLPCGDDPCDFPKAECYMVDGEFRIKVYIDDVQLGILIDALNIGILEYGCQIRKLFEYYTENAEALKIADELTEILMCVETVREIDNKIDYDLVRRLTAVRDNKE